MSRLVASLPLFLFLCGLTPAHAQKLVNVTIDDSDPKHWFWGDFYTHTWQAITPDQPCGACTAKLNASETYNNTWHDASGAGTSALFTFTGSAVYMYGIDYINAGDIDFALDDTVFSTYTSINAIRYNSSFFNASGLDPTREHYLSINISEARGGGMVALIDYAVITTDPGAVATPSTSAPSSPGSQSNTATGTSTPSQTSGTVTTTKNKSHSSKTGAIVGGVVGGIAGVILLALLGLYVHHRSQRQHKELKQAAPDPLVPPSFVQETAMPTGISSVTSPITRVDSEATTAPLSTRKEPVIIPPTPTSAATSTPGPDPSVQQELESRIRRLEAQLLQSQRFRDHDEESLPPPY